METIKGYRVIKVRVYDEDRKWLKVRAAQEGKVIADVIEKLIDVHRGR